MDNSSVNASEVDRSDMGPARRAAHEELLRQVADGWGSLYWSSEHGDYDIETSSFDLDALLDAYDRARAVE